MSFVNIAAYKFIALTQLASLQAALREKCLQSQLKGTILLSEEGINVMLAGTREAIDGLRSYLLADERFADLSFKESISAIQPFQRLFVKIKKEIIAFRVPAIKPQESRAPAISPEDLKKWLDEGRELTLLDARNTYEIAYGTFVNAVQLNIRHFRDFPDALHQLDHEFKQKPVVTFCTGGIRCEKAALFLQKSGFQTVYQLNGGILKYFEVCGGAHFLGHCFVFDDRVAVDTDLR